MKVNHANYATIKLMKKRAGLGLLLLMIYLIISLKVYQSMSHLDGGFGDYIHNHPTHIRVLPDLVPTLDTTPYQIPHVTSITFQSDNLTMRGWHAAHLNPTGLIILIPGHKSSKKDPAILLAAGMLYHHNFDILIMDYRDQGDSQREDGRTALGNDEYRDVLASIQWATDIGYSKDDIGLYGISLGGAIAIIAGNISQIGGVFTDSAFSNPKTIIQERLQHRGLPTWFYVGGRLMAWLLANDNLVAQSPVAHAKSHTMPPLFLTHARQDTSVGYHHAAQLASHANASVWATQNPGHAKAIFYNPKRYQKELHKFFTRVLN